MILRYSLIERSIHWLSALTYMYVLATGLAFFSPYLYWIAAVLGGGPTARFWHPWIGILWFATVVWMLSQWYQDMRITDVDRRWGREVKHYIRNEDEELPPAERFNVGQKYFFWLMLFAGLVLLLTGLAMWSPGLLPLAVRPFMNLIHASAALITIGAFIIHVYMGTAMVRGGFTSIIRGEVSPDWARTHHRLWYNRVTGQ
jgi:formate dehydrogenase subunit gamma